MNIFIFTPTKNVNILHSASSSDSFPPIHLLEAVVSIFTYQPATYRDYTRYFKETTKQCLVADGILACKEILEDGRQQQTK